MRSCSLMILLSASAARPRCAGGFLTVNTWPEHQRRPTVIAMREEEGNKLNQSMERIRASVFAGSMVLGTLVQVAGAPAFADEYEAPTVFTGESVMICKRRGPLGACLETVVRTEENDNDKAKSYFRDPTALLKEKEALMRESNDEGNQLIQKLRQQSRDNSEKNDLYVQRKTFENDQSGYMGPFDRQVLIMNTDGKTFTVLENPQAMRLKDSGFIVDRRFVKQPTDEELERALTAESTGLAGMIQGIFGGSSPE